MIRKIQIEVVNSIKNTNLTLDINNISKPILELTIDENKPLDFLEYEEKLKYWGILSRIISGKLDFGYFKKGVTLELTTEMKVADNKILYYCMIKDKELVMETLFCNNELAISKARNEQLAEIGKGWSKLSDSYPQELYPANFSILNNIALKNIKKEFDMTYYIPTSSCDFLHDKYDSINTELKQTWRNLMSDLFILKQYQKLIPQLGFNVTEVTDDLRYISPNDPEGIITSEMHGTGFNKLVNILPFMINCYTYGGTLIIPYFISSLHPNLLQFLLKLFHYKADNKGLLVFIN